MSRYNELTQKLATLFANEKVEEGEASVAMAMLIGVICANTSQTDYQTGLKLLFACAEETASNIAKAITDKKIITEPKPKPATAYTIPINSDGEVDDVVQHTTDDNRVEYRDGKFVIGSKS